MGSGWGSLLFIHSFQFSLCYSSAWLSSPLFSPPPLHVSAHPVPKQSCCEGERDAFQSAWTRKVGILSRGQARTTGLLGTASLPRKNTGRKPESKTQ